MHDHTEPRTDRTEKKVNQIQADDDQALRCDACRQPVDAQSRFCPNCGVPRPKLDPPAAKEPAAVAVGPAPTPTESTPAPRIDEPGPLRPLVGAEPAQALPPAKVTCSCGRELAQDAQYCDRCGNQVGTAISEFRLVGISADVKGRVVPLASDDLIIGKEPSCDLSLARDDYASRRHARVFRSQRMFFLEDLGSSNGTFLRVRRPIVLETGDEIVVGASVIRLEECGDPQPPAENS